MATSVWSGAYKLPPSSVLLPPVGHALPTSRICSTESSVRRKYRPARGCRRRSFSRRGSQTLRSCRVLGRSETKANHAISDIVKTTTITSHVGGLEFLYLDLADLRTIKPAVQQFLSRESRLDVPFNNAGIAQPPRGSVSAQGTDLQLATNCLGPFLLTRLLLPVLQTTAREFPQTSVRVVWTSSQAVELGAAKNGFSVDEIRNIPPSSMDPGTGYIISKLGNWYLSCELARRHGGQNVISVAANPGSGNTGLFRHTPWLPYLAWLVMYKVELLANTALFAGLSEEIVSGGKHGLYVAPWGRIWETPRWDLLEAIRPVAEGGLGSAGEFWDYCGDMTGDYM